MSGTESFSCLAKELFRHLERKRDFRAVFGVFRGFFLFCFVISSAGCCVLGFFFVFPFPLEPRESLECVFVKAAACKGLNPGFGSTWLLASCPHSTGTGFFLGQKSDSLHLDTGRLCRTILGSGSGLIAPKSTFFLQFVSKPSLY